MERGYQPRKSHVPCSRYRIEIPILIKHSAVKSWLCHWVLLTKDVTAHKFVLRDLLSAGIDDEGDESGPGRRNESKPLQLLTARLYVKVTSCWHLPFFPGAQSRVFNALFLMVREACIVETGSMGA